MNLSSSNVRSGPSLESILSAEKAKSDTYIVDLVVISPYFTDKNINS